MKKNLVLESSKDKNNSNRKKIKEMNIVANKSLSEHNENLKLFMGDRKPELKMVPDLKQKNAERPAKKSSINDRKQELKMVPDSKQENAEKPVKKLSINDKRQELKT